MKKKPIVYLVIIIIAVMAAVFFFENNNGANIITNVIHPTSTPTTTKATSTTVQTTQPVTTAYQFCVPRTPQTFPLYNGNFSTGTYEGWNVSGKAFGKGPLNLTYANNNTQYYGAPWSGYSGRFAASTFTSGFLPGSGNLTSGQFKAKELYLNFQIESPQNKGIYVEILSGNSVAEIVHFNTFNGSITPNYFTTFMNGSISLAPVLCQNVSVRVVADVQASTQSQYSYISIGDFYIGASPVLTPGIITNVTLPGNG